MLKSPLLCPLETPHCPDPSYPARAGDTPPPTEMLHDLAAPELASYLAGPRAPGSDREGPTTWLRLNIFFLSTALQKAFGSRCDDYFLERTEAR